MMEKEIRLIEVSRICLEDIHTVKRVEERAVPVHLECLADKPQQWSRLLCSNLRREILDELNRIFKKGMPSTENDISALRSIGFTYTQSRKHPKLHFHDKYMFILPCTPGDKWRGAKNSLAEVNKCIALSQKV